MEAPVWTEQLSVGDGRLDAQHQALFEAAGRLLASVEAADPEPELRETLAFLRRYTLRHFAAEEAILQVVGYPAFLEHRAVHAALSASFVEVEARATRFGVLSERGAIEGFIQTIVEHIQTSDAAYGSSLKPVKGSHLGTASGSRVPFSLGFPSLDQDHECFHLILDDLQEAIRKGQGEPFLGHLLERVQNYAQAHFRREELMMELVDYPNLPQHAAAHAALLQDVLALRERHRHGEPNLAQETLTFIQHWLREHLGKEDLALVPFLKSLGRL